MATKSYKEAIEYLLDLVNQIGWVNTESHLFIVGHLYDRSATEVKADLLKVVRAMEIKRQQDEAPDNIGIFRL